MGTVELWGLSSVGETGYWDTRCLGKTPWIECSQRGERR